MNDQNPPYPGQGTPLPHGLSVGGYWVHEGKTFLFHETITIQELFGLANERGGEADGFGIETTAEKIGISAATLVDINRRGLLRIALEPIAPEIGADSTVLVTIQTPDEGFQITMNRASRFGRA